jgi:hypothetical protein
MVGIAWPSGRRLVVLVLSVAILLLGVLLPLGAVIPAGAKQHQPKADAAHRVSSSATSRRPAQSRRPVRSTYQRISNDFATVDGVLHSQRGRRARTALVTTHPRSLSNLTTWPCEDLPRYGVDMLCFNNRYSGSEAGTELNVVWEEYARDVAAAVQHLRDLGYKHVGLYGGSAGGPLMSYYQNVAENGNAVFEGRDTLSGFEGYLSEGRELRLPRADFMILRAPTMGTSSSFLLRLDGSIVNETTGERDPSLYLYNPANGFDPSTGSAKYSAEFLERYHQAQGERMNRIIADAVATQEEVEQGRGRFTDDEYVVIPGARADPAHADLSIHATTAEPWLVLPDRKVRIVKAHRPIRSGDRAGNLRTDGGSIHTTESLLSYRVVPTEGNYNPDAVTMDESGIDFDAVNSTTPGNIRGVSVPILIIQGTADDQVHLPSAELNYNSATATDDKTLVFIEGATHSIEPIASKFGDTREMAENLMGKWLRERFRIRGR